MQTEITTPNLALLPEGCTVRQGSLDDYLIAFQLANAYSRRMNGSVDINDPEIIRTDWLNPDFNPGTDIHLVLGPGGELLGLVESWLTHKPPVHPWNWVCVHPDHLQDGIWEYLLLWAEQRSLAALEQVPADLRVAAITGTEHHNEAGRNAAQKLGWNPSRSFYRMVTDLTAAPVVPALPAGITLRLYDPATELEEVYRTFVDSFRDHYGFVEEPFEDGLAHFKHNLVEMPGSDPNYWFVAMDGDQMAGICLCMPVDMEDPESGWVNELGVRRAWRKQGLGGALLLHSFAAFYARGQKRAALGVDASSLTGALRLYENAGMRVARQFDQFEKELRPGREISTRNLE